MAQKRLSGRSIREVLRLKYGLGRSHPQIAVALGIANSTVSLHVGRAVALGHPRGVGMGRGDGSQVRQPMVPD